MGWLLLTAVVCAVVYAALIAALALGARHWDVRLIARAVPHCAVLFKRLLADRRVPSRWKMAASSLR